MANSSDNSAAEVSDAASDRCGSSIAHCRHATTAQPSGVERHQHAPSRPARAQLGEEREQVHRERAEQRIGEPHAGEAIGGVGVEHRQVERRRHQAQRAGERRFARALVAIDGGAEQQIDEADGERQQERRAEIPLGQPRQRHRHARRRAVGMPDVERDVRGAAPAIERRRQRRAAVQRRVRQRQRLAVDGDDDVADLEAGAPSRPVGAPQRGHRARAIDEEAAERRIPRERVRRDDDPERHQPGHRQRQGPDLQPGATHLLNRRNNLL